MHTTLHVSCVMLHNLHLAILGFPLETISSSRDSIHWNLVVAGTKAMKCNQLPVLYTNHCEKILPFYLRPVWPKLSIVNDNYLGTLLITFSAWFCSISSIQVHEKKKFNNERPFYILPGTLSLEEQSYSQLSLPPIFIIFKISDLSPCSPSWAMFVHR